MGHGGLLQLLCKVGLTAPVQGFLYLFIYLFIIILCGRRERKSL